MTAESEKAALLKQYYPTLYITGENKMPTAIAEILRGELLNAMPELVINNERGATKLPATYLIAFNPDRQRK